MGKTFRTTLNPPRAASSRGWYWGWKLRHSVSCQWPVVSCSQAEVWPSPTACDQLTTDNGPLTNLKSQISNLKSSPMHDQADELRILARQWTAEAKPHNVPRKVVVSAGKGGVGTTTIAVN